MIFFLAMRIPLAEGEGVVILFRAARLWISRDAPHGGAGVVMAVCANVKLTQKKMPIAEGYEL